MRCRGARFHGAGDLPVQRGDRQRGAEQGQFCHRLQDVDVAGDQRRFGDDVAGVAKLVQHLQQATCDLFRSFRRLIGVGIDAQGQGARLVFRVGQFLAQRLCSIGLAKDTRLEIEAGRQVEIGVGRSRKAIDASVLAALVRIDRFIEPDIGRIVGRDDLANRIYAQDGLSPLQRFVFLKRPAVVDLVAVGIAEARAGAVGHRSASLAHAIGQGVFVGYGLVTLRVNGHVATIETK